MSFQQKKKNKVKKRKPPRKDPSFTSFIIFLKRIRSSVSTNWSIQDTSMYEIKVINNHQIGNLFYVGTTLNAGILERTPAAKQSG